MHMRYLIAISFAAMVLTSCEQGATETKPTEQVEAASTLVDDSSSKLAEATEVLEQTSQATPTEQSNGSLKIGYLNSVALLLSMDATQKAEKELADYEKRLVKQLENKQKEFQGKYEALQQEAEGLAESMLQLRMQELQTLENSIMQYQNVSQQELAQKRQELMSPIEQKIQKAIDKVASERGYDYVIDASSNSLVYGNQKYDLNKAVAKELGIKLDM